MEEIKELIKKRDLLRKEKRYKEADGIRDELKALGVNVEDYKDTSVPVLTVREETEEEKLKYKQRIEMMHQSSRKDYCEAWLRWNPPSNPCSIFIKNTTYERIDWLDYNKYDRTRYAIMIVWWRNYVNSN
jgi:hypothetical protein